MSTLKYPQNNLEIENELNTIRDNLQRAYDIYYETPVPGEFGWCEFLCTSFYWWLGDNKNKINDNIIPKARKAMQEFEELSQSTARKNASHEIIEINQRRRRIL